MSTPDSPRLQQLFQFLESSPNDPFLLFAIAKEYDSLQAPEKTLEYYLILKEKAPDYVGLYYHLGKLYEGKGDFPEAIATYKKGMEVAKAQGDRHALSELAGAKLGIVDEEDEE